ncbi:aldehyde dehydrogenase family protein, partial [Pseudomonadales bacterium]|nr:aldehyde dehydrogenase family protein [Pseudomonadales bacterium]
MKIQTAIAHTLTAIGVAPTRYTHGDLAVTSPVDGRVVAQVHTTPLAEVDTIIDQASTAFQAWRQVPAPRRGEL